MSTHERTGPLMARYWVNAPSTLQSYHRYHGLRVFGPRDLSEPSVTVYPVTGETVSMTILSQYLSPGWPSHLP